MILKGDSINQYCNKYSQTIDEYNKQEIIINEEIENLEKTLKDTEVSLENLKKCKENDIFYLKNNNRNNIHSNDCKIDEKESIEDLEVDLLQKQNQMNLYCKNIGMRIDISNSDVEFELNDVINNISRLHKIYINNIDGSNQNITMNNENDKNDNNLNYKKIQIQFHASLEILNKKKKQLYIVLYQRIPTIIQAQENEIFNKNDENRTEHTGSGANVSSDELMKFRMKAVKMSTTFNELKDKMDMVILKYRYYILIVYILHV